MKHFLIGLFFFFHQVGYTQPSDEMLFASHAFENTLFFIGRGTLAKRALVAEKYNNSHPFLTHIGLGLCKGGRLEVFHVSDAVGTSSTALKRESLHEFASVEGLYYLGIWGMTLPSEMMTHLDSIFYSYEQKLIRFDAAFLIKDDDDLYCSEFCVRVLSALDKKKFSVIPWKVALDNAFFELVLDRVKLTYYPVDFFLQYAQLVPFIEYVNKELLYNKMP